MSAPKTIYVHKNICNVVENGELSSTARVDRRWQQDIEYRLVDPNEQSKIERIRAEIKSLSVKPRVIDDPEPGAEIINDTIFDALQIIDIVSNESNITDNGGDS